NIALPLTNAFVGEFLMFSGIFNSHATEFGVWFATAAAVCIIFAAVYTLNMVRKTFYGELTPATAQAVDLRATEKFALIVVVALILVFGVYPQHMLDLTKDVSNTIVNTVMGPVINK